jgi:PhnB protein
MAKKTAPIPPGYRTVTPYLIVKGAAQAIAFYRKAFGATEVYRMPGSKGKIIHAEVKIGDSVLMLSDEMPGMRCRSPRSLGGTTVRLMVYARDVDRTYRKAVAAGAKGEMEPRDMFWGDRYAKVRDPFGHQWDLATHIEDVPPAEIRRRQEEFFGKAAKGKRKK